MSKRKKERVTRGQSERRKPSWTPLGRRAALLLAVLLAAAVVIITLKRLRSGSEASVVMAPFPPASAAADSVDRDDFAGSESCAGCHATQYAAWSQSTHGRAGQAPPGDLLLRRFDGSPIRFRDATVEPRSSGGNHEFIVRWADRVDRYPIEGVIGAGHMIGGGTQGFVWRHPDGSLRLLPFELTRSDSTWFCNTDTRANRGWAKITDSMSVAECGDWPPVRVLGSSARFASCQECHGSQIELVKGRKPNETRLKSLAINCESCHGPARRHVEAARTPGARDVALQALATFARDSSVGICLACHALKSDVSRGYLPGRSLEQHYSLGFPLLDSDELHADGRTKTFAYQQGHLYSDCYLSGSMTCVDCHEPHGQQYRDVQGRTLQGRFDDAQCTSCHPSKAQEPQLHTRHAVNSAGSRCVSCHMPFVQAAVGNEIRYTRSDHTISIPRADVDARLGVVNACRTCHQEKSTEQLVQDTRRLWGELKPMRPIVAQLIRSKSAADIEAVLVKRDTTHRLAYFDALARYFAQLEPDANAIPRRLRSLLWQLADSRDDDVAAIALATLHLDAGREPATRTRLIEHVRALGARDLRVRRRWAIALGHRGDALRAQSRGPEAITLYEKALELQPNDGAFLLTLGLARLDSGDRVGASTTLRRAVDVDPENSLAWLNYGRARSATGDEAAALAAYRRATQVNPYDPVAYFNLGNVMLRRGSQDSAVSAYRRAIELDVSLAPAHFNLARALLMKDRKAEALSAIRTGLIFQPDHAEARAAAEELEAELRPRAR